MSRGFSQEDIQRVREATDIVALVGQRTQLKQRGTEFWGCCPFHNEKTASFKVDSSTQLWHCFGCSEGGDVFAYQMKIDDMNFPEAVRYLAEKANIDIHEDGRVGMDLGRKKRLKDICNATADFYHEQLMRGRSSGAASARSYLAGRNLGGDIPKIWKLGYAPGRNSLFMYLQKLGFKPNEMVEANVVVGDSGKYRDRFFDRVIFPINDISSDTIAFGGRILGDGKPKYLNSQETPIFHKSKVLFGLDKAKAQMASTGIAVVAEGYTDVIALHKAGIGNAVACLGTALTKEHIRQLSRHASKRIIYLFDGDEAGQRATERALQFIDAAITPEAGASKIDIYALTLPDGLDPQEYIEAHGADEMKARLGEAEPLIGFGIERRLSKHDISTPEGRSRALADVLSILAPIKTSILAKEYALQIAGRLRFREEDVLKQLEQLKEPAQYEPKQTQDQAFAPKPARTNANLSKAEQNRSKIERQFLGLAAQNPTIALALADTLVKTKWRSKPNSIIASSILSTLTEDLTASPAQLIETAELACKGASSVLTATTSASPEEAEKTLRFLANELSIGDIEEEVLSLKSRLAQPNISDEEEATLFAQLVALQKELTSKRIS